MAQSLREFVAWCERQTNWKCWFGRQRDRDSDRAAKEVPWDLQVGIDVLIGGLRPRFVFALAEPHRVSPKKDHRVAAWTTGNDSDVNTSRFATVYTPASVLGLADIPDDQLKPLQSRRSR
jgi:hypothetical protein